MLDEAVVYLMAGLAVLLATLLPSALSRVAVSPPMVLLGTGALIGLLPFARDVRLDPVAAHATIRGVTQFAVLLALMGVGLALDRPLQLSRPRTFRRWSATWRLLLVAMPLTIAAVWALGWIGLGVPFASALLLGAALAPTDPVLAGDVQVGGPDVEAEAGHQTDEHDEVRFALTSEGGLNDGLAFPWVWAAILLVTLGPVSQWLPRWIAWELVGKVAVGFLVGAFTGWVLSWLAFRVRRRSLRLAEQGEPLLALAVLATAYGAAEALGGYGFVSVFCAAMAIRNAERRHHYNEAMHELVERLERLFTLLILLLLGMAMTHGLFDQLDWRGVVLGVLLVVLVRPVMGVLALLPFARRGHGMGVRERLVTGFFGVRGVGSLYYLAFATSHAAFERERWMWATVGFTIALSVVVHGVLAKPAMDWLERRRITLADP